MESVRADGGGAVGSAMVTCAAGDTVIVCVFCTFN
jgi:hypothetical protein